ncbi:hypothetical protein Tco_1445304, partial [Tanacetum coccineum]
ISGQEFDEPLTEEEALSFIRELGHSGEIKYITDMIVDHLHQPWRTFESIINKCLYGKEDLAYQIYNIDSKKQEKMFYPRFTKIIIHHFLEKDKSISMRNRMFMHTARDDSLLGTMRFLSKHEDAHIYGAILPKAMTNQAMLDTIAYKTYYEIASGAEPLKSKKPKTKSDSAISFEETPSKKMPTKAKKDVPSKKNPNSKPKPTKKKAHVKADIGKASGSGDGTDLQSGVPNELHRTTSGADEGTDTKPGVLDVPKYDYESDKESWGDSEEEDDDDEDDTEDDEGNDDGDNKDDDKNDDEEETDSDRTGSDRIKIPVLNQSTTEYYEEEEEETVDDEEKMDEEDDEVTKELYKDMNVNLGNEDAEITNADQGGADQQNISQESVYEQVEEHAHVTLTTVHDTQKTGGTMQSSSVSSDFTSKLLNLKNPSPANNEIASLIDTTVHHEELGTTPTPTPTALETTTSFLALLDFASVFKLNKRVTNLEKDLAEMKQVNQYAKALSSIPAIVDHYIDNKLGEVIQKAIQLFLKKKSTLNFLIFSLKQSQTLQLL